jgi:outer membrane lipoprotein-sorting protein
MVTTSADFPPQTTKVWFKGDKMRTEMNDEGETIITILDNNARTMYVYYESTGMVMVMNYQPQESALDETRGITDYNPVILGTETYDGKECMVIQYTIEGATIKMWIWKQYGFPIKVETTSSRGTYIIEYRNVVFNSVTDDVFVLPSGLTTMTFTV